jgi:hypothetical protein
MLPKTEYQRYGCTIDYAIEGVRCQIDIMLGSDQASLPEAS